MNKGMLEQQVNALSLAQMPKDTVFAAANVAQFCLQQLLVNDAGSFSMYLVSRLEIQEMFADIYEIVAAFLENHWDECGVAVQQRIAPKIERSKSGIQNYLGNLQEQNKKERELISVQEQADNLREEIERLEEEQQSIDQKIQELKSVQAELSVHDLDQLEKDLSKLKKKLEQENEIKRQEEQKEQQLAEDVQSIRDCIQSYKKRSEEQSGALCQEVTDILNRKTGSREQKKEKLQKLEQREEHFLACGEASAKNYADAKKRLEENERIASLMKMEQAFSEAQLKEIHEIKMSLEEKMREFGELCHLLEESASNRIHVENKQ